MLELGLGMIAKEGEVVGLQREKGGGGGGWQVCTERVEEEGRGWEGGWVGGGRGGGEEGA